MRIDIVDSVFSLAGETVFNCSSYVLHSRPRISRCYL